MYLHCKAGLFEVDRWDGSPVPVAQHQEEVERLIAGGAEGVVVVRCRHRSELEELLRRYSKRKARVWKSPPSWDYPFRAYLTLPEWSKVMALVAADLDYRNFKSWCHSRAPDQHELATAIWNAAFSDAARRS